MAALVEEQRGDEEHEEELGVHLHEGHRPQQERDGQADGHLHEGQRDAGHELLEHRGDEHRREQHEGDMEQGHGRVLPSGSATLPVSHRAHGTGGRPWGRRRAR